MKHLYSLLVIMSVIVSITGCKEDDSISQTTIQKGDVVEFNVKKTLSRANYPTIDDKQIVWESNDSIRIFCYEANNVSKKYADYTVTPQTDNSLGTIAVAEKETDPLVWGDENTTHNFYAIYPANENITVSKEGIATFPINRNQKCYIREVKTGENYTYVAEPHKDNIYMVAKSTSNPATTEGVWLEFEPIMTTVNIIIKGPQELYDSDGDGIADAPATEENQGQNWAKPENEVITGVSILSTLTTNSSASRETFQYDFSSGQLTGSSSSSNTTATEQTETTFVSLVNENGESSVSLGYGETLALTVFLPPMEVTTAEALNRLIKIRVHTTGGQKVISVPDAATVLLPKSKGAIKLPAIYTPIDLSAWMTNLDDNIYISQLSIPGTHDAATKECSLSQGRCQDLTISEQLEMGIRFFDLRPRSNLDIYHGEITCNTTLSAVWDQFNDFLDKNPGEFIFTLIRWENEGDVTLGFGLDAYETFNTNMMNFVASDRYKKYALPDGDSHNLIKKDLTIGEMRPIKTNYTITDKNGNTQTVSSRKQGRILTLLRPNQDIYVKDGETTTEMLNLIFTQIRAGEYCDTYITGYAPDIYAPDGMLFYTNFPGSLGNAQGGFLKKKFVDYTSTDNGGNGLGQANSQTVSAPTDWDIWCQNYYEVSSGDEATKIQAVKDYMDHATTQAEQLSHVWVINHCSGYVGSALQSTAYANLANKMNPEIYDFIQDREPGALGFVLLDFVGSMYSSASETLPVYGNLLPQTIIDNNYKYHMKRKGE